MKVELDLAGELLIVYNSVKQGYIDSNSTATDLNLNDALARLDVLINILKGE